MVVVFSWENPMKEPEGAPRIEDVTGTRRPRRSRTDARRAGPRARVARNGNADLEQFLKQNASSLTFLGVTLGVFLSKKFLILPVAVGLMLAQDRLLQLDPTRLRRAFRR
jgi:hypothetical protein